MIPRKIYAFSLWIISILTVYGYLNNNILLRLRIVDESDACIIAGEGEGGGVLL